MPTIAYDAMVAGGLAGVSVDIALFPLDTVKTRLQSSQGFMKAGGFSGIYRGLASAAAGSFPTAATFFVVYETAKPGLEQSIGSTPAHMVAGAMGETCACLLRVPTENVKQKMQAGVYKKTGEALRGIMAGQGVAGFWTGYGTTVAREIPFSMIQFPLWEGSKARLSASLDRPLWPWESAACGSASGAFAAAVTTPLDVVKTRLMLGADAGGKPYHGMVQTFKRIHAEEGAAKLLSGIVPRVFWIGIGGFVFFGAYESARVALGPMLGGGREE